MEFETRNDDSVTSQALNGGNIFCGVVAYVEVWSGNENRCNCVKTELKSLGAEVHDKFSSKVTHVLFNEGSLTTYKKAKIRNIPLVSVLWIEESKRLLKKACENKFSSLHLDRYEEPDIFSAPNTFKRPRHVATYRRTRKKKLKSFVCDKENDSNETYFNPEMFNENAALVKDGIISTLEHVTGRTFAAAEEEDIFPCSQFTAEINEPLTKKLYNRFLSEVKEDEENEGEDPVLRHSCPAKLQSNKSEGSGKIYETTVSGEKAVGGGWTKIGLEKNCSKKAQVPITFFFQAAVIPNRLPSIVLSGLPFDEVELLTSIVKKVGGFRVERTVTAGCKHVICCYPPKRTLNVLRGIARGCWILSKEWVLKSLDCNKWLDEGEFELSYFLPAITKVRVARQKSSPIYRHFLFSGCGPFYLTASCCPPAMDLKELLLLCGGCVVSCLRSAKVVVVGQGKLNSISARRSRDIKFVTEKWVLDSISEDSVRPFSPPYTVTLAADRKST